MDFSAYQGCLAHLCAKPEQAEREDWEGLQDDDRCYYAVDPYQLDLVKILGSKALARLIDKTQVFFRRNNPHIRTRDRHTHDTAQVATLIAITGLNKDLMLSGAFGHDIGHLPFGHNGETALGNILGKEISHATVAVVLARRVERKGVGLNLTTQTLEIILNHSSGAGRVRPVHGITQEAAAVMWADKAYVFADASDFRRCLQDSEPKLVAEIDRLAGQFGCNQREQVSRYVYELVAESAEAGKISFEASEWAQRFAEFKSWLYSEVYPTRVMRSTLIEGLYRAHDLLGTCPEFADCDKSLLLALLTDSEAWQLIEMALDHRKLSVEQISHFGITEIYKHLQGVELDLTDPWA